MSAYVTAVLAGQNLDQGAQAGQSVLGPQHKENIFRWGTIVQVAPLRVQLDGDTAVIDRDPYVLGATPILGARVWTQMYGRRVLIIGKVDPVPILDTGWVNLTPSSGTGTFRYRVYDRTVYAQALLSGVTSIAAGGSAVLLAASVLPAAYRPSSAFYGPANFAGSLIGLIAVASADGAFSVLNSSASAITTVRFYVSWFKE